MDSCKIFATVAKLNTIIVILALKAPMDLEIHQLDVKTTFLNDELDMETYMEQQEVFEHKGKEHLVCKLKKSLYGLKHGMSACTYFLIIKTL